MIIDDIIKREEIKRDIDFYTMVYGSCTIHINLSGYYVKPNIDAKFFDSSNYKDKDKK